MTRADTSPATLAEAVRDARSKRQLTQEELAQLANVSAWTVNRVERGHTPSLLTVAALAGALDASYDELKALREAS